MTAKLVISTNGLEEIGDQQKSADINPVSKAAANFISYFFHPVFVPLYVIALLLFVEPFLFVGTTSFEKVLTFGRAFINYTFFPLVSVFLLRALKFISSISLKERKDRIIPFIICNIWYFWMWYVWRGLPEVPHYLVVFAMSVFLASSAGLVANSYIKISMHGIALGTATAFLCILAFDPSSANLTVYVAMALLITGIVGTSRVLLAAHTLKEYYWGVGAGVFAVITANLLV